ncbi:SufD family Fe-S cluster assembly protein [Acuticoccus mangrovi]|uniref:SufD family Fe-S cluster assembly protein n=1 Tax=Acuticoccus mangrovi TaxID=2796142 RepID=A0A934MNS2_9HYPH|nr:SufD family Fe-S cluster assembly protein [Acuticoccus mangrovi]MBJ3778454.1 SufD family Fe-S cluster assembly protein [Acuticoccus mangrovi]
MPALSNEERNFLAPVGYEDDARRSGTCILVDQSVRYVHSEDPQVEIMPLKDALGLYSWVQDLMFGLISPDENEHVKLAAERTEDPVGHFVRVREGAKVRLPLQTFSVIGTPQGRQFIHDITVIEKGAEVEMISGSAVPESVRAGHHVSIGEAYIHEGAVCRSLTIEQWGVDMDIHSYNRTKVGAGARVSSNQVLVAPVKHHASNSVSFLGENAVANDHSVVFAPAGANRIMRSETHLNGKGARSESLTRMVTAGGSITNEARLVGEAADTYGFLGCDGLKMTDEGEILSVPALLARHSKSQLSHEASVGMISEEKMAYLMSSGMSEDLARDLIVEGFLNLKEQDLPSEVRSSVKAMIEAAKSGSM